MLLIWSAILSSCPCEIESSDSAQSDEMITFDTNNTILIGDRDGNLVQTIPGPEVLSDDDLNK